MRSERGRSRASSWWWSAAGTVTLSGCALALLTISPPTLVATAVVFAGVALLVILGVESSRAESGEGPLPAPDWRWLADRTATGTVGAVAVVGLLQVSVGATALVVACLALSAPWALSSERDVPGDRVVREGADAAVPGTTAGSPGATQGAVAGPLTEPTPPAVHGPVTGTGAEPAAGAASLPDVHALSTTELVLAWRRSYAELARARTALELQRAASRRRQLLDELEQRDGLAVERWLRSGARAASDPSRFLQRPSGPSPA